MAKAIHILLVEDDGELRTMIKLMLEYKGFSVTSPDRVEQTEEVLRHNAIDLVIMDMLLSGVNGVDICAVLKSDNETKHVPVLMISAHPNAKPVCLKAGADDFISKPFEMQDLIKKIYNLVNKNYTGQEVND